MKVEQKEVTVQAGDTSYTIRFPNKALCALEDDMGLTIQQILALFSGTLPGMSQTRQIFRRGLVQHHGEMELDGVSEIMDQTDYMKLVEGLLTAIAGNFQVTKGAKNG